MSVERVKLNAVIWLALGLFIGVVVGLGINKTGTEEVPASNPTLIPGRVVNVTIDQSQQDELFGHRPRLQTRIKKTLDTVFLP